MSRLNVRTGDLVSRTMTETLPATLPTKIDADVTLPDGTRMDKVRIVYRHDGLLQGVSMGNVVVGPTSINDNGVSRDTQTGIWTVSTPLGTYLFAPRKKGCGCGA